MMPQKLVFIFFLLGMGTLCCAQTDLSYKLRKGDQFTIEQKAEQHIIQELEGTSHEITNEIGGILEFKVDGVKADTFFLSFSFKNIYLKMTSSIQGELMNVNASEGEPDDLEFRIFNSLLNTPINMKLNKKGEILEVTGGDSLISKMTEAAGIEDDFSKVMMRKSLEKEYGSDALTESYEQMTYLYAERPVKIGESWKNEYKGQLSAKNTWTLNNLQNNSALISCIADITMNLEEGATKMQLAGKQETELKSDLNSGFLKEMIVTSEADGVSSMAQSNDLEIPTKIRSTITYKLIDQKHVQ